MNECWQTPEVIQEMNKNYPVYLNLMNETEHINVLKKQITTIENIYPGKVLKVIDLGCGTAQISLLFDKNKWIYVGVDMPHIIEGCAKKWHPERNFIAANLTKPDVFDTDLEIGEADVILMNAFIDVMLDPSTILDRVLSKASRYVILHRQEFAENHPTVSIVNDSYNAKTYHSIINNYDFNSLLEKKGFISGQIKSCGFNNWNDGGTSLILYKTKK